MARRRRRDDDGPIEQFFMAAFHIFKDAPVWLGPTVAIAVFVFFRFFVPIFFAPTKDGIDSGMIVRLILPYIAWFLGGGLLVAWLAAEGHKLVNRARFDKQTGADSIRHLTWGEFEHLVAEAYRRRGYAARVVGNPDGDGGVDVELTRPGETVLVQCKHWKAWSVGVQVAREFLGVVVHRGASRGIIVTSGRFNDEARAFADGNAQVELVDGSRLVTMIEEV